MLAINKFLKSVFNFFVGDWIILIGVSLTLVVAWLSQNIANGAGGYVLLLGLTLSLIFTLRREVNH